MPYLKTKSVFHCPDVPIADKQNIESTYCYSDLPTGANTHDATVFSSPRRTIILMEGDLTTNDVGHSWMPEQVPQPAVINHHGMCEAGQGATVQDATTRHTGQANYLFADGHVEFFAPSKVFFPPRMSASRSHKDADGIAIGPDPAGNMTFAGTIYAATFHLR